MFEAYGSAFGLLFQPVSLVIIFVSVLIGLIVGAIPTIGGLTIIPLLLPFIFRMPPEIAILPLVALHSVIHTSSSIPSILIGVPGTGPSAATVLDGFPMTQKGEGTRAVAAAIISSAVGGIVPVFLALLVIPLLLPLIIAFGQPEMALLIFLAVTFIATLTGKSVIKGLLSGFLGMLISLIGYHTSTGVHRFSFGSAFLFDGIDLIPLTLGLFGLAQLIDLSLTGKDIVAAKNVSYSWSGTRQGIKDVWIHRWLWLRSTIIGYIVGIIPGIGAGVATWMAYGQAKQTSKKPEEFGSGRIEGVIAPEAADNANEAGDLLTTMALGIPGGAASTLLLGAFIMVGITPGPAMLNDNLPIALSLLIGIAVANLLGGGICLFATPFFSRLSAVRRDYLFASITIIGFVGAYTATLSVENLIVAAVFAFVGVLMIRNGYSRPALLLGFVLGSLLENYTILSLKIYGSMFFMRPICVAIIITIVILFAYRPFIKRIKWGRSR